jgi:hypothetical protein
MTRGRNRRFVLSDGPSCGDKAIVPLETGLSDLGVQIVVLGVSVFV